MRLHRLALIAGLAGIAISAYLTVQHYAAVPLACPVGGVVNCEVVLTSSYGVIGGSTVPTSAAGIVWFVVSAGLAAALWRRPPPLAGRAQGALLLSRLQLGWSAIGLVTVLYLVYIEIVELGAICIWCSAAHVLVLLIFLLALPRPEADRVRR